MLIIINGSLFVGKAPAPLATVIRRGSSAEYAAHLIVKRSPDPHELVSRYTFYFIVDPVRSDTGCC